MRKDESGRLFAEAPIRVEFYDVDSMRIAWHGNYPRFFELGRCALLDGIGYGYDEMEASGYGWPVVTMSLKYVKPLVFKQEARIKATLLEYENRLRIGYLIYDPATGAPCTKGESVQMAIDMKTRETLFESPACFASLVLARLADAELEA